MIYGNSDVKSLYVQYGVVAICMQAACKCCFSRCPIRGGIVRSSESGPYLAWCYLTFTDLLAICTCENT